MYSYEYIVCYKHRMLPMHGNDDYKTVTRYPLISTYCTKTKTNVFTIMELQLNNWAINQHE